MKSTMRQLIAVFTLLIAAICTPSVANAGVGDKTIGFAGGYASHNGGGYADVYFQYTFAPHLRIAPEIGYVFRNEGKSAFIASVDLQLPFGIARGFNVYPLVGATLNCWDYQHGGHATRGGFDFGGGFDIGLTPLLKLNVQCKYSLMNDTSGCFLNFGLGYNF